MNEENLKLLTSLHNSIISDAFDKYGYDENGAEFKAYMDGARKAIASLASINAEDEVDDIDEITIKIVDGGEDDEDEVGKILFSPLTDEDFECKDETSDDANELIPIYLRCGYSDTDDGIIDINFYLGGENFRLKYDIADDVWGYDDESYLEREEEIQNIIETYAIPRRDDVVIDDFLELVDDGKDVVDKLYSILGMFRNVYGFNDEVDKVAKHKFAEMLLAMERTSYE